MCVFVGHIMYIVSNINPLPNQQKMQNNNSSYWQRFIKDTQENRSESVVVIGGHEDKYIGYASDNADKRQHEQGPQRSNGERVWPRDCGATGTGRRGASRQFALRQLRA